MYKSIHVVCDGKIYSFCTSNDFQPVVTVDMTNEQDQSNINTMSNVFLFLGFLGHLIQIDVWFILKYLKCSWDFFSNRLKCHSKNTKMNLWFTLMITFVTVVKREISKQNRFCNNHFLREKKNLKSPYLVVNSCTKKKRKKKIKRKWASV